MCNTIVQMIFTWSSLPIQIQVVLGRVYVTAGVNLVYPAQEMFYEFSISIITILKSTGHGKRDISLPITHIFRNQQK